MYLSLGTILFLIILAICFMFHMWQTIKQQETVIKNLSKECELKDELESGVFEMALAIDGGYALKDPDFIRSVRKIAHSKVDDAEGYVRVLRDIKELI